ncbi:MAG: HeH/LEM domain-containing protein [Planctomycetota bacterium]
MSQPATKLVTKIEVGAFYEVRKGRTLHYPPNLGGTGMGQVARWALEGMTIAVANQFEADVLEDQRGKLIAVEKPREGSRVIGDQNHPITFKRAVAAWKLEQRGNEPASAAEALAGEEGAGGGSDDSGDPVASMKVDDLKAQLDARGLEYPSDARKADLQVRLRGALAAEAEQGDGGASDDTNDAGGASA